MKSKVIYLFVFIFSVSLFSAARKYKCICTNVAVCNQLKKEKCIEAEKPESQKTSHYDFSNPSLFLLNI